jgi:hypothetical protein
MSAGPADSRAAGYGTGIIVLAVVSLVAVLAIVWAEVAGYRLVGGAAIGVILIAYSFILLFLRKGGFTGV